MKPVAASSIGTCCQFVPGRYIIVCNGVRLNECYDFNEAEGWADCWTLNTQGEVHLVGNTIASHRVTGEIRLIAEAPETRAWFEEHFAV